MVAQNYFGDRCLAGNIHPCTLNSLHLNRIVCETNNARTLHFSECPVCRCGTCTPAAATQSHLCKPWWSEKCTSPTSRHQPCACDAEGALDAFGTRQRRQRACKLAHARAQHLRTETTLTSVDLCRRGLPSTRCAVFARCLARARAGCCGII